VIFLKRRLDACLLHAGTGADAAALGLGLFLLMPALLAVMFVPFKGDDNLYNGH
jgi:hypothetical protein